jgi:predicted MFS family arabinose efflux permease
MKTPDKFLVFLLAALQMTHILDFVVLMPLGPQLMRDLSLNTASFGLVVSAYTFSAGIFGFLGAFFLDRFDRKKCLIVLYSGFILGTVLCAIAPSYGFLLLARIFSGAFGGVLTATVFSVIGDVFPESQRGSATGAVMAAFSIASVVGIPVGLELAHLYSWRAPFVFIVLLSLPVLIMLFRVPRMTGHLTSYSPVSPIALMTRTLADTQQVVALFFSGVITISAFLVIPFLTPFFVGNLGFPEAWLGHLYLIGGVLTFITSRWIGGLSDRYGKRFTFVVVALLSLIPIFMVTHMTHVGAWLVFVASSLFMVLVSGRFVPVVALLTSCVPPEQRGSFMSFNSSVQQLSSGFASLLAGYVLTILPNGELVNFGWLGLLSIVLTLLAVVVTNAIRVRS